MWVIEEGVSIRGAGGGGGLGGGGVGVASGGALTENLEMTEKAGLQVLTVLMGQLLMVIMVKAQDLPAVLVLKMDDSAETVFAGLGGEAFGGDGGKGGNGGNAGGGSGAVGGIAGPASEPGKSLGGPGGNGGTGGTGGPGGITDGGNGGAGGYWRRLWQWR